MQLSNLKYTESAAIPHHPFFLLSSFSSLILAALCFFPLLLSSPAHADDKTAESLYRRGLIRFKEGMLISARLDFNEIIKNHKTSPNITSSYMIIAKIYYKLGEYTEASAAATDLQRRYPTSGYYDWADYMNGACKFQTGKEEEALNLLARLAAHTRDQKLKTHVLRALRNAVKQKVDPAVFRAALERHNIGLSNLDGLDEYSEDDIVSTIEIEDVEPEPDPVSDLPVVSEEWDSDSEVRIGLLAPLTGPNSQQGKELLKGVEEAYRTATDVDGRKIVLIVEDTESDMITSAMKTRELAKKGVITIIGPVYGESTVSAALEANNLKVPFLAPTAQSSSLTKIGGYIFQLNINPVVQSEALAEFAVEILGLSNAAIVASKEQWGEEVAEAFEQEMIDRGARIVKTAFVDQNVATHDINRVIMSLRESAPYSDAVPESTIVINNNSAFPDTITIRLNPARTGPQKLVPVNTIECVLISALCNDAVLIAEQIAEYNINTVFLGDSGWSSDNILEKGGTIVDGSYMISMGGEYFDSGENSSVIPLQTVVSKKGYDSFNLIVHCLRQGAIGHEAMVKAMETIQDYKGISSRISIDPERHFNIAVDFVKIQDGAYIKIPHNFNIR